MGRERVKSQDRERARARGRLRTSQMREGLDELDLDRGTHLPVGTPIELVEYGGDDEWDPDLQVDDGEPEDAAEGSEDGVPLADGAEEARPKWRVGRRFDPEEVFGSRFPPVHVRLEIDGDSLRAVPMAAPGAHAPGEQEAITELTALVAHAFRPSRRDLWQPLVHGPATGPIEQLLILARLALRPSDPVPLPDGGSYSPDDRELARFRRKFARFPDGTPFCVALLLKDERGRKRAGGQPSAHESGLADLPDSVVLIGLQNALDAERAEGVAQEDTEFARRLRKSFEALGLPLGIITDNEVRRLRDDLKRRRKRSGRPGGVLFLNRRERQQAYDGARPGAEQEDAE